MIQLSVEYKQSLPLESSERIGAGAVAPTKPNEAKPVGIWLRVSTEDQARGESPEVHENRARILRFNFSGMRYQYEVSKLRASIVFIGKMVRQIPQDGVGVSL